MDLPHAWKLGLRRRIPWPLMNALLIRFPRLYETKLVNYESHISPEGLKELIAQLDLVENVPGDVIECGSAHCGTSVVMARHIISRGATRLVLACDSYEGFDQAELARERAMGLTEVMPNAFTSTSLAYVQNKIGALRLGRTVIPIKGYFKDTLPGLLGPFCLALIDCDLRDSVLFAANTIWPRLSPRGRLIFDDYTHSGFKGAKEGVDLFVEHNQSEIAGHGSFGRFYYVVRSPLADWDAD